MNTCEENIKIPTEPGWYWLGEEIVEEFDGLMLDVYHGPFKTEGEAIDHAWQAPGPVFEVFEIESK